jgi:hypothetical protein
MGALLSLLCGDAAMKVSILDDYHDTLRTLACFS